MKAARQPGKRPDGSIGSNASADGSGCLRGSFPWRDGGKRRPEYIAHRVVSIASIRLHDLHHHPHPHEAARLPVTMAGVSANAGVCEVIVADAGSAGATLEAARAGGAKVVASPRRNRGAQMNLGARSGGGAVLLFLHADTRLPATAFERMAAVLEIPRWWAAVLRDGSIRRRGCCAVPDGSRNCASAGSAGFSAFRRFSYGARSSRRSVESVNGRCSKILTSRGGSRG